MTINALDRQYTLTTEFSILKNPDEETGLETSRLNYFSIPLLEFVYNYNYLILNMFYIYEQIYDVCFMLQGAYGEGCKVLFKM